MPNVYIIAGPNGAGKTTFAREFLPNYAHCKNFVNADLIAQGLSPFHPEAAAFRAGRLMMEEIETFAAAGADFGFETTLSGKAHVYLIRTLKRRGYEATLLYLWIPTVEFALRRIQTRVAHGGHDVPGTLVRRRFRRSITNFFTVYRQIVDSWMLFDNSGAPPQLVAHATFHDTRIIDRERYEKLSSKFTAHEE